MIASEDVSTGAGSQASLTTGGGNTGLAGHWMGETVPGQLMLGGVVSLTVMICAQLAVCPHPSVAVHVRVIVPPQAPPTSGPSLEVTVGVPQLSEAVPPVKLGAGAGRHWIENPAGHVMLGLVVSLTLTIVLQVLEQPVLVTVSVKVKLAPQVEPALTETVWPEVEPGMEPLPVIDQR